MNEDAGVTDDTTGATHLILKGLGYCTNGFGRAPEDKGCQSTSHGKGTWTRLLESPLHGE